LATTASDRDRHRRRPGVPFTVRDRQPRLPSSRELNGGMGRLSGKSPGQAQEHEERCRPRHSQLTCSNPHWGALLRVAARGRPQPTSRRRSNVCTRGRSWREVLGFSTTADRPANSSPTSERNCSRNDRQTFPMRGKRSGFDVARAAGAPGPRQMTAVLSRTPLCPSYAPSPRAPWHTPSSKWHDDGRF
jgi:hypothetical protein